MMCGGGKGCQTPFHSECIDQWAACRIENNATPNCPSCRTDIEIVTHRFINNMIEDMEHPCRNHKAGCKEILPGRKRKKHEARCRFGLVDCMHKSCNWSGQRRYYDDHLAMCEFQKFGILASRADEKQAEVAKWVEEQKRVISEQTDAAERRLQKSADLVQNRIMLLSQVKKDMLTIRNKSKQLLLSAENFHTDIVHEENSVKEYFSFHMEFSSETEFSLSVSPNDKTKLPQALLLVLFIFNKEVEGNSSSVTSICMKRREDKYTLGEFRFTTKPSRLRIFLTPRTYRVN